MEADTQNKIEQFFSSYPSADYKKGEVIIQAYDSPTKIIHLLEGQIEQYDISPAGEKVIVNIFKPPAFFPMSWAINKTENDYFFEAATDISVKLAPPDDVVKFLKSNPDVMLDLLARVYSGVDGVLRRMAHLMGGTANTRLLYELINQARRFGQIEADGRIVLKLNERELANRAGLTRETVSRSLSNLGKKELIIKNRQELQIPNLEKLEEFLGKDL